MVDPLAQPDAIIELAVNRYLSVTQGLMGTSGANPDVVATLIQDAKGRIKKQGTGGLFEVTGSNAQGSNKLDVLFRILPPEAYDVVDLVIKNLQNIDEGGTAWDNVRKNRNEVTVTDHARKQDPTPSITYAIYVVIKPRAAGDDFPLGDIGVIDPLWINR